MVSVGGAPLNRRRWEGWQEAGLRLRAYTFLSQALSPNSYPGKIMLGAFVGIPIPLLALVLYLLLIARIDLAEALPILAVVLAATVVGGALTLFALYALLAPVSSALHSLRAYLERAALPSLPTRSSDDEYAISHLDEVIRSLEELSAEDPLTESRQ
jgi:hypothetical protein